MVSCTVHGLIRGSFSTFVSASPFTRRKKFARLRKETFKLQKSSFHSLEHFSYLGVRFLNACNPESIFQDLFPVGFHCCQRMMFDNSSFKHLSDYYQTVLVDVNYFVCIIVTMLSLNVHH